MDVLIVKLDGDVIDDLDIEGDGNAFRTAQRMSQQAVVIAAATAQAFAITGEGKTGNEDNVELSDADVWTLRIRLPDVHLAAMKVFHASNMACPKPLMFDLEKTRTDSLRQQSRKQMRHEVGLIFQSAKECDCNTGWPCGGEVLEVRCDVHTGSTARGFIQGTQAFAHELAQRGFVVHGVRSYDGWNARELKDALTDRQECLSYLREVRVSAAARPHV